MSLSSVHRRDNIVSFPDRGAEGSPATGISIDLTASPFVGRQMLLASLVDDIRNRGHRLVTLTGPGGIGKSRLAQELTRHLAPSYGDRVAWLSLAHIQHEDLVVAAFAEAFGLEGAFGPSPTLDRAVAWLGDAPALLILDNAEHLPGLARGVACVLRNCPHVVFVITGRVALGMEGEHVVVVPPLEVTPPDQRPMDDAIYAAPALRLFAERARRAAPGFRLTTTNVDAVARVCTLLGGMPLAIELAASRSAMFSPADLLDIDQHIVSVIDEPTQASGGRDSSLEATIGWAFDRLSPEAREAAAWLALAAGGFSLATARSYCGATQTTIAELLDHHLIHAVDDAVGRRRFGMHELIRHAALELLNASGEREAAEARFRAAMGEVATAFLALPHDGQFDSHLAALIVEAPNLRQALTMALDAHEWDTAVSLLLALEHYWVRRSRFDEMSVWLERIRALEAEDSDPGAFATFSRFAASMLAVQGNHAAAIRFADDAVGLARADGDERLLARCLLARSWVAIQLRDFTTAHRVLDEIGALERRIDHPKTTLDFHTQSGVCALFEESLDEAETWLLSALQLCRARGGPDDIARLLHFLGYTMQFRGAFDTGRAYLDEALANVGPNATRVEAVATISRARLEIRAGRPDAAAPWVARVLRLRFGIGDHALLRIPLIDAAIVLHQVGHTEQAALALGAANADDERAKARTLFNEPGQLAYDAIRAHLGATAFRRLYHQGSTCPLRELVPALIATLDEVCPGQRPETSRGLSARERDVLALMAQGLSNREIGNCLYIGTETVKTHIRKVLQKLEVTSRSAAVAVATREGLVPPPGTGAKRDIPHREPRPGPVSSRGGARGD